MEVTNPLPASAFNWPTPNRSSTMYLSKIGASDIGVNAYDHSVHTFNIETRDISGRIAMSEKPVLRDSLFVGDIAQSQSQIRKVERDYNPLANEDIPRSKSQLNRFQTNRLPLNPLNPNYPEISAPEFSRFEPKFLRDAMNVDDIAGAKPKFVIKPLKKVEIDNDGPSNPNSKSEVFKRLRSDPMKLDDITTRLQRNILKSKRHTNVLDPRYAFYDCEKNPAVIGQIDRSNPPKLFHEVVRPFDPLSTKDIQGASPLLPQNPAFRPEVFSSEPKIMAQNP